MQKYINDYGKECYSGVTNDSIFSADLFHVVKSPVDEVQVALHTNLGSITVLNRMTGYGFRDTETGFRDPDGRFWLASGQFDIRNESPETIGDAIRMIKNNANTCNPDREA